VSKSSSDTRKKEILKLPPYISFYLAGLEVSLFYHITKAKPKTLSLLTCEGYAFRIHSMKVCCSSSKKKWRGSLQNMRAN